MAAIKKIFCSKFFLFLTVLALIGLAVSLGRETYQKYKLNNEIERLEKEIGRLEGDNQQLGGLMDYLADESYLEKEARLRLNLKKPGEKLMIFPDEASSLNENNVSVNLNNSPVGLSAENQIRETANHWKWWEYFFAL